MRDNSDEPGATAAEGRHAAAHAASHLSNVSRTPDSLCLQHLPWLLAKAPTEALMLLKVQLPQAVLSKAAVHLLYTQSMLLNPWQPLCAHCMHQPARLSQSADQPTLAQVSQLAQAYQVHAPGMTGLCGPHNLAHAASLGLHMPHQHRLLPQARPLSSPQVLPLLQEAGPGTFVQREYLQHLASQDPEDPDIHTELAVQLAQWAAAEMPDVDPRCAPSCSLGLCMGKSLELLRAGGGMQSCSMAAQQIASKLPHFTVPAKAALALCRQQAASEQLCSHGLLGCSFPVWERVRSVPGRSSSQARLHQSGTGLQAAEARQQLASHLTASQAWDPGTVLHALQGTDLWQERVTVHERVSCWWLTCHSAASNATERLQCSSCHPSGYLTPTWSSPHNSARVAHACARDTRVTVLTALLSTSSLLACVPVCHAVTVNIQSFKNPIRRLIQHMLPDGRPRGSAARAGSVLGGHQGSRGLLRAAHGAGRLPGPAVHAPGSWRGPSSAVHRGLPAAGCPRYLLCKHCAPAQHST